MNSLEDRSSKLDKMMNEVIQIGSKIETLAKKNNQIFDSLILK